MDAARYYIALALIMMTPGVLVYWVSIHPFVAFWRKLGPRPTITLHCIMMVALGVVAFVLRKPLLATDYGTNYWLIAAAIPIYAWSIYLRRKLFGTLTVRVLAGVPELSTPKSPGTLLTTGPYAQVRHPRYIQLLLAMLALSLFANHLATYVAIAISIPWVYMVTLLEERELRNRFGEAYHDYCTQVPRFLPR